ncbi:MAG: ATP-binding protein, partial [Acidimicrobiales bacterium]
LNDARAANTQAINDLRGLVYGLRPPALDELGLIGALRAHADSIARSANTEIVLEAGELPPLPAAAEVATYRVVTEAINNAIRHGHAQRCHIEIRVDRDSLILEVCDNGHSTNPWEPGVGLNTMRERIAELGGHLTAGPNHCGATVRAVVPLTPASKP